MEWEYSLYGWTKENYGGEKTKPSGQRAMFVGRWQPYHNGHIELVLQKLDKGIPVLILVRDVEPDDRNPFTTEQTVQMIEKYHKAHGHDVIVSVIPDIESINFGRGVGYEVNQYFPHEEIAAVSATKIRESVRSGNDEWRSMVDKSIQDDVVKFLGI